MFVIASRWYIYSLLLLGAWFMSDYLPLYPRARTWPWVQFLQDVVARRGVHRLFMTRKDDGFFLRIEEGPDGEPLYFTKGRKEPIRSSFGDGERPANIFEAIAHRMRVKFPHIRPREVVDHRIVGKGRRAVQRSYTSVRLYVEFWCCEKGCDKPYLPGLFHRECFKDGYLDDVSFDYFCTVFDAQWEEGQLDQYWQRYYCIQECVPIESCLQHARDVSHMLDLLLEYEGLVCHDYALSPPLKVKMEKVPVKGQLVAVANTIPDFNGFDKLLFAVPSSDGVWTVVHAFDWTDIFTRHERRNEGKTFINKHSVKVEGGVVTCSSSSGFRDVVDAVFRSVSKAKRLPPVDLSARQATARFAGGPPRTIVCGPNRSFSFRDAEFEFLAEPVDAVLGCVELWELKHREVHLQATKFIAIGGYGHEAYRNMQGYTTLDLLRTIAASRNLCPREIYRMLGIKEGPFLGYEDTIKAALAEVDFTPWE